MNGMPEVSNHDGICCLKGRENLIPETRMRLVRNGIVGKRYEAEARRFAGEYASLCPFILCIAIAGSVASDGFSKEDDVDFNIFVEQRCKYTVYLFGILLSLKYSFRHRKKPLACKSRTPFLPKLIYYRDSCETNVRKTLIARILHLTYTNCVVSKPGERMCKGTSTFLGGLYSSHAGITSKPSLCEVEMQKPYALFGGRI